MAAVPRMYDFHLISNQWVNSGKVCSQDTIYQHNVWFSLFLHLNHYFAKKKTHTLRLYLNVHWWEIFHLSHYFKTDNKHSWSHLQKASEAIWVWLWSHFGRNSSSLQFSPGIFVVLQIDFPFSYFSIFLFLLSSTQNCQLPGWHSIFNLFETYCVVDNFILQ